MLAVLLARSLLQLAQAVEAAGPKLLYDCLSVQPPFHLMWWSSPGGQEHGEELRAVLPRGSAPEQTAEGHWRFWQLAVLHALQPLLSAIAVLGMSGQAGDAEGSPAAAAARPDVTASSSSSMQASNAISSSSSRPKWGHLLLLQQFSPDCATAVNAFSKERPGWGKKVEQVMACVLAGTPVLLEELQLLFDDALQLIKELVDAAPLPVVCNNPSCDSLAGVREAAAACKACAICRCRYCSEACQKADWKRHKPVCKRMVAADMTCA
jgi:hypothetical protein